MVVMQWHCKTETLQFHGTDTFKKYFLVLDLYLFNILHLGIVGLLHIDYHL